MRSRSSLTSLAKTLRKAENNPEARLWLALKGRQLEGHKFRRQVPIGPYIADFACIELRLVVELDGSQHIDSAADAVRNVAMANAGWSVARFPSGHMLSAPDGVIDTLLAICDGRIASSVASHDFQFKAAKNPSSGPSGHLLPLKGEKWKKDDLAFMRQAIELATAQMGKTWPNPSVGCVLVKDGVVIAEGATGDGGRPHAEEIALDHAGDRAQGAIAYVTLEPCGERSNGGCSCGQRLAEAGVARVVYACDDPSPLASHKGPQRLKAAGIPVESGLLAEEGETLIEGFVHWLTTGRPLLMQAAGPERIDAWFTAGSDDDLAAELHAWGERGYRTLGVPFGSDLAHALRRQGLLSE